MHTSRLRHLQGRERHGRGHAQWYTSELAENRHGTGRSQEVGSTHILQSSSRDFPLHSSSAVRRAHTPGAVNSQSCARCARIDSSTAADNPRPVSLRIEELVERLQNVLSVVEEPHEHARDARGANCSQAKMANNQLATNLWTKQDMKYLIPSP